MPLGEVSNKKNSKKRKVENRKRLRILPLTVCYLLIAVFSPPLCFCTQRDNIIRELLWKDFLAMNGRRPKIAVVLGGGGARGLSHIGVLKVLEENKIPIDIIVGTSAGALVGGLYASGMDISEIENIGKDIGWDKISDLSTVKLIGLIATESLLSSQKLEKYLEKHIGKKRFDQLKIPFACIACDVKTGERIIFKDGEAAFAMRASATIPAVFEPVEYRHRLLIDGGVVDNLPVDIARVMKADFVIAVWPKGDNSLFEMKNVLTTLNQVINIQGEFLVSKTLDNADFLLIPDVRDITMIELDRSQECIETGLVSTRSKIDDIKGKILERFIERIVNE
ncbi:MAG: patatin-like phospholipase family protein [Elusimicrobia bacterium]|nr:patatin-like phospholipase family protein [Elusimicrobiota bacterium]